MAPFLFLLGRLIFGAFFVFQGVTHFREYRAFTGYARDAGFPSPGPLVLLGGVVLVVGGLSVMFGLLPRLGALVLAAFLVPVTWKMHAFWAVDDPAARVVQMTNFLKNVALFGGALSLMGMPVPWPFSVASGRMRRPGSLGGRAYEHRHA